ncbi:TPA: hypothetical protein NJ504_002586 [Vibrio parahaemolyticus]|nr:hypothetical protein [Vibrio parahaemolyticus]HCM0849579.1 hypothetical protein [Vibrio parahaemolyticus]
MNEFDFKERLRNKIIKLSQSLWENKIDGVSLDRWLDNFSSSTDYNKCEQTHALYLLSNFMYFGTREIRELLKSLYRDKYLKPLIQNIRRNESDTKDIRDIEDKIRFEIKSTRFLGIGNPSESGTYLLYFFRQENGLGKENFIHSHEILSFDRSDENNLKIKMKNPTIKRYVFLDDVCGSGTQAIGYSRDLVSEMKKVDSSIEVYYFTLFSTVEGMKNIRENSMFDQVDCIFELDESFKCFSNEARQFRNGHELPVSQEFAKDFSKQYGTKLLGGNTRDSLGYKDSQLLLGFAHNTPDNTLPIIWAESGDWEPLFKRYHKYYGLNY